MKGEKASKYSVKILAKTTEFSNNYHKVLTIYASCDKMNLLILYMCVHNIRCDISYLENTDKISRMSDYLGKRWQGADRGGVQYGCADLFMQGGGQD